MLIQTILKSVSINSSREKIWDVITNDRYNRIWFAEFSVGTHAVTDWKEGSKVTFTDDSQMGIVGKIDKHQPGKILAIVYEGLLSGGMIDVDSPEAKAIVGGREIYQLVEQDGRLELLIESDMGEEYFEMMSASWDRALAIIKSLSESA